MVTILKGERKGHTSQLNQSIAYNNVWAWPGPNLSRNVQPITRGEALISPEEKPVLSTQYWHEQKRAPSKTIVWLAL